MRINDRNIEGIKETVDKYNGIPVEQRTSFNIWYDIIECKVMLIQNDIFEQSYRKEEPYYDISGGFTFLRYENLSDLIKCVYPYVGTHNLSMSMLRSVLLQYFV